MTPGLPLGLQPCNPFALIASPRLGLRHTMLWHERLGHLNMARLKDLDAMVDGMNLKEVPLHHVCEACIKGKHQRTSFPKDETTRASKLLELVHSDVCGPMKTTSRGGARYFIIFIDDFLRKNSCLPFESEWRGV